MSFVSSYTTVDGVRLHHRTAGSGEPILLLHPGPGLDGSVFFPCLFPLADRYRMIALDLPGCGRSDDGDRAGWSLTGMADTVTRFAATLGLDRYTLLGHSFGGFVALTSAVRHPGAATRIVASCTAGSDSAYHGFADRLAALRPVEVRDAAVAAFEREGSVRTAEECRQVWADQLPFFLADPTGPLVAELTRRWARVSYRPEISRYDGFGELELLAALRRVDVPALVVAGREDRCLPVSAAEAVSRALPDATLRVIPAAGHFPFAEQPAAYLDAVTTWLDQFRLPPG